MRYSILGILFLLSVPATTHADDRSFRLQIARFLVEHFQASEALPDRSDQVGVSFSIDRDGKLLSAEVDQSSGSARDDQSALERLRKMQPFPHAPDNLDVPYKIFATAFLVPVGRVGHVISAGESAESDKERAFKNH